MCSYFRCAAYEDIKVEIRVQDNFIFLALKDKENQSDVHITLNPIQVRTLAKYLSVALGQISFIELLKENNFGDLTVEIEYEDKGEDYAQVAPF